MWGLMFMLGMALVSGFASVPGVRYSAVPQEVCFLLYPDQLTYGEQNEFVWSNKILHLPRKTPSMELSLNVVNLASNTAVMA